MAPVVPYKPIPRAAQMERIPEFRPGTTGEQFGTTIGSAQQRLGATFEKVGSDLGHEALAFQHLNNETWAKDNFVLAEAETGQAVNDYNQLEGTNQVNALPGHQTRLQAIRQKYLNAAPNAAARQMLDQQLSRRLAFQLVDAGGRAGQSAKTANRNAGVARRKQAEDNFDLTAPELAADNLAVIKSETIAEHEHHGSLADTANTAVRENQSRAVRNGVIKLSPTPDNVEIARKALEQFSPLLLPNDREAIQSRILGLEASVGARDDAQVLLRDPKALGFPDLAPFDPDKGPGQLQGFLDAGKKLAEKHPDNPAYADNLEARVRSHIATGVAGYKDTQLDNRLKVQDFVLGRDPSSKIVDMDAIDGPNAPPEIAAAYRALNSDGKKAVQKFVAKENKTGIEYTAERQARFNMLMGMAVEKPNQFTDINVLSEDLPRAKIDILAARQRRIKERKITDPETVPGEVRDMAKALGIMPSGTSTTQQEQWLRFRGAFQQEIDAWQDQNGGKKPDHKQMKEMARYLLKEVITSKGMIWDTKQRRFDVTIPEDDSELIKKRFIDVRGYPPTPEEIRFEWLRAKKFKETGK